MKTIVETARGAVAHSVVSHEEWLEARRAHLLREKEFTRLRDELSRERQSLPWERVEKEYLFHGAAGTETLADLFDGRSQLIVQHFMLGPGWEEGCAGCSFWADHHDGVNLHLPHHDVTLLAASRAPWAEIEAYRRRMGWRFKWVSSQGSDFNYDYHVSFTEAQIASGSITYNYEKRGNVKGCEELPGFSIFYRDAAGAIFHTYSGYARSADIMINTYNYLDFSPKGRNEASIMDWMRRHDRYEDGSSSCCHH